MDDDILIHYGYLDIVQVAYVAPLHLNLSGKFVRRLLVRFGLEVKASHDMALPQ